MKIKEIFADRDCGVVGGSQGGIEFSNGWVMTDIHYQDCCENVYADWGHLKHEAGIDHNFDDASFFVEKVPEGFRFGDRSIAFFVPCYNEQNGWYNSNLDIEVYRPNQKGKYKKIEKFSVSADTIDEYC